MQYFPLFPPSIPFSHLFFVFLHVMPHTDFNSLRELLLKDRSYRRFDESCKPSYEQICKLVELATLCASGRNAQPLRYRVVTSAEDCAKIFPHLAWAGYFTDWDGPAEGERPTAYLIQCIDTEFGDNCLCDDGLQLQAITLGATSLQLGCCIIKAFNATAISQELGIPSRFKPRYVLAIGKPAETVVLEYMDTNESSFKYYRTSDGIHHVPKRTLSQILI